MRRYAVPETTDGYNLRLRKYDMPSVGFIPRSNDDKGSAPLESVMAVIERDLLRGEAQPVVNVEKSASTADTIGNSLQRKGMKGGHRQQDQPDLEDFPFWPLGRPSLCSSIRMHEP